MRHLIFYIILFIVLVWAVSGRCFAGSCFNSGNCGGSCICIKAGNDPTGYCAEVD